ncbi:MAG: phytanoyl-CoA dioxygenase family protein [Actinomycetota bacterium]|nr:phytanoyl-CoA dioxygenase family protein [Actinomycetota bacterium]
MRTASALDLSELRERLDVDGYAVIPGVVSPSKVATFADEILATYAASDKFDGGGSFSGHLNCFPGESSRFFYDEIADYGLVDAIDQLRPDRSNAVRATLNFNLPGSVAQHYHIDGIYMDEFLVCNVAVVDTDLVNGAIDMLPGTHRQFYKFWQYALQRKYRLTTRLPMRQGDILVRRSTVWHRGMPNKSVTPRPMMSLTFGEKSAPDGDPFMVNDGKMLFYPNWFNTSRAGQLRERTFVAAPFTYSTYRFVTSLHGNKGYESY